MLVTFLCSFEPFRGIGIFSHFRAPLSIAVNLGGLLLIATKYQISVQVIKFKQLAKFLVNTENKSFKKN
jgi:hypothetical protein